MFYDYVKLSVVVTTGLEPVTPRFCIDCNVLESYHLVYQYILDKVELGTYIYVDEYFDSHVVTKASDDFSEELTKKYKTKMKYVRSAGSVGALFRIVQSD